MEFSLTFYVYDNFYKKQDYKTLREILNKCCVNVLDLNQVTDVEPKNQVFKEDVTKVQAIVKYDEELLAIPRHYNISQTYCHFIQDWCKQTYHSQEQQRLSKKLMHLQKLPFHIDKPWLMIHNNYAFAFSKKASHEKVLINKFQMGTLIQPTLFFAHYEHELILGRNGYVDKIDASFYHDTCEFYLNLGKKFSLSFNYRNIRQIIVEIKDGKTSMYLYLINPPALAQIEHQLDKVVKKRTTNILKMSTDQIGRSNAICLEFAQENETFTMEIVSRLFFRCGRHPIAFGSMRSTFCPHPSTIPIFDLGHFGCNYILNSIFQRNFVLQLQEMDLSDMLKDFCKYVSISPDCFYEAGVEALQALDEGLFIKYRDHIAQRFIDLCALMLKDSLISKGPDSDKLVLPPHTKKIWRLVVTPTRRVFFPAEVNFENRIIRNYDSEYALRVSFRDEDYKKLSFSIKNGDENFVKQIITEPILEGIKIGDKHFEFLGWSNSQLRDHGVFMYAKDPRGNTAESIRSWMGNFSHIKSVAKFMARMGQCFSHSEASITVPLNSSRIITEPDITGGLNPVNSKPYVFSDGVGKISVELMKEVTKVLGFDYEPSAIQFRYAGYKGMLTVDPTLKDFDIVFRQSQKKFHCEASDCLEVVNKSKPVEVLLNRNIIAILESKGIASSVFLEIQQEMLKNLTQMLFDSEISAKYLTAHSALPKLKYNDLHNVGICCNSEPLFRNMLLAEHRVAIEGLRTKTRLQIEPNEGRNMFGVIDETGTLEYGEVFVQYTINIEEHPVKLDAKILTGNVLVTKNPCLQLGDVRVFKAIDVPELHHIVDCIVFPQKGSDLDGDEYTVIWKQDLIFKFNSPASDFPIAEENVHIGPVLIYDMLDFLSYFIVNDQIGVISHAHMAQADSKGLSSDVCKRIAYKHSIAVDFAKNGQQVTLDDEERPQKYPDFMEKGSQKKSYYSKRILGKLYRVVKHYEDENKMVMAEETVVEVDELLVYPGWEKFQESANKLYQNYSKTFSLLLSTYGILNESDACGKAFSTFHRRADRNERLDIEEIMTISLRHLWKTTYDDFFNEFQGMSVKTEDLMHDVMRKASACYVVVYSRSNSSFLSFPWVFWKHLVQIRRMNVENQNVGIISTHNPYVAKLHAKIEDAFFSSQIDFLDEAFIKKCSYLINDPKIQIKDGKLSQREVEKALVILLNWGIANELILNLKKTSSNMSSLYFSEVFFLSVKRNHIWSKPPNSTELLLNFFNFTMSSQYLRSKKSCERQLCKLATSTYHSLAVGGYLKGLKIESNLNNTDLEDLEMDPIRVDKELLKSCFGGDLENFKSKMLWWSKAREIHIRQKTGMEDFCLVSASGSNAALIYIRKFLMKLTKDNLAEEIAKIKI